MKRTMLLISSLVCLSSCKNLPDVPWCRPLNAKRWVVTDAFGIEIKHVRANPVCMKEIQEIECGYCKWTLSERSQYVGDGPSTHLYGKPWSQLREEAVYVPSEAAAEVKSKIVSQCKRTNCDRIVPRWRVKLDSFDSVFSP